ncbi:MAG: zinc ribbon domain-containing protein [Chloroflexota bacterium]
MSAALGLYRLQQIDSQMDQARTRLEAIRQTLENDADLRAASERATAAEKMHQEAERAQRQAEAEVQSQKIKIEQAESSLYGGAVRNPKELQELQHDVASLKKYLATLEDRLLEAMLTTESAASSLTEARAALSDVESNLGDQTRNLTAERATLAHALERLDAERKAAASPVNATLFEQYETLRRERRGIAVTTVSDGSCDACGTTLTPAQQQTARSSAQIARCPTCGRILFAD